MAKKTNPNVFECPDLALCVLEAMAIDELVEVTTRIPELAPDNEEDYEDESESWRDALENNQTRAVDELVALLEKNRDKLPKVREVTGVLMEIAEDEYEPEMWSLAGIEACTGLEQLEIWTSDPKLDLSPLAKLPKLATVDLTCAGQLKNLAPLLDIPSLKTVIAPELDAKMAAALTARGVIVKQKAD